MKFDGKAFGEEVVGLTRSFVERQIAPLRAEVDALKKELAEVRAVQPKDGLNGKDGAPGEKGDPGERGIDGAPGKDGPAGRDGKDGFNGKDVDPSEIAALRSAIEAMRVGKADNDLSDREFERRVDAALAESHVSQTDVVRDAVVVAMREAPRPTINVSVPITMPRRGKEVMTVEHDAKGRIKRSIKEEVD